MVLEHGHEYPSQWKAIESIAEKLGIHRETLRVCGSVASRSTRAIGRVSRLMSGLG